MVDIPEDPREGLTLAQARMVAVEMNGDSRPLKALSENQPQRPEPAKHSRVQTMKQSDGPNGRQWKIPREPVSPAIAKYTEHQQQVRQLYTRAEQTVLDLLRTGEWHIKAAPTPHDEPVALSLEGPWQRPDFDNNRLIFGSLKRGSRILYHRARVYRHPAIMPVFEFRGIPLCRLSGNLINDVRALASCDGISNAWAMKNSQTDFFGEVAKYLHTHDMKGQGDTSESAVRKTTKNYIQTWNNAFSLDIPDNKVIQAKMPR